MPRLNGMHPAAGASLIVLGLMVAACGGGGVNSTPTPTPPTPTPTPAPTPTPTGGNASLLNLTASQSFVNDAATSSATIDTSTDTTIAATHAKVPLQIRYDLATGAYTVSAGGKSQTFGNGDKQSPLAGQVDYRKQTGDVTEYFTLTSPGHPLNLSVQYVGGAYWQRNRQAGNQLTIDFDVATYGIVTPNAAVPRTGAGRYDVNLFGFLTPPGQSPKVIEGEGDIYVDFATGTFMTEGGATEIDLTDPYWTGEHDWRGGGHVASAGSSFSGNFAFDGRDRLYVSGTIDGHFYGPQSQEVGAVFSADDASGAMLVGTLIGATSSNRYIPALTVIEVMDGGPAQTIYGPQTFTAFYRRAGETGGEASVANAPNFAAKIDFNSNGSVVYNATPTQSGIFYPTFAAADRVAAESDARYTVYRTSSGGIDYRLVLSNPGAGNPDVKLTYSSFARWDRVETTGTYESRLDSWSSFGIPTPGGTLPRSGAANYSMIIRGSGYMLADSSRYDVTGNAALNLNLASMTYTGTFAPLFTPLGSANSAPNLGTISFNGEMNNVYGFQNYFNSVPPSLLVSGDLNGRLYGPLGEEIGASWTLFPLDDGRSATGMFAGVAVGKKN